MPINLNTLIVLATIVSAAAGSGFWLSDKFAMMEAHMTRSNDKIRASMFDHFTGIELRLSKLEMVVLGKDPVLKPIPKPSNDE